MRMGEYLISDLSLPTKNQITHRQLDQIKQLIANKGEYYFQSAQSDLAKALSTLYGQAQPSLQRLSATFRRGDLIEELAKLPLRSRPGGDS